MMWKKALSIIFGLMMLAVPVTFKPVSAADGTIVILVSNNEADCALANYIANLTVNVVVIKTPWGVYDPNVTAEIISYAPDEVIIIGGPVAVPEEYAEDLQNLGITVERWWGENRYETDLAFIKNATVKFQLQLQNRVILVAGTDLAGIEKALQLAIQERAMIILVNQTTNITRIMEKLRIRTGNFTTVETPYVNQTMLRIHEQLRKQFKECNCTKVQVNMTAERALEAIQIAEEKINTAKELAENATNPAIENLLAIAEKQLEDAKDAYNTGKYGLAYGLAIAAKSKAEVVIRLAGEDIRKMIAKNTKMRLEREIVRIEAQIRVMERLGVNVTVALQLMEQIKAAIRNGDYDTAQELMVKLREQLRTCYMGGKDIIKEKSHMPVGGRRKP
ncbi:hypothetical protein E3E31_03960 [Thermococcus sp. M39]|uniref:cell wall-binding repeat-containing protein n=1 Tax=unclassified Thermococcus TaxID=2627626 RepID=UPI001438C27B|nr:MULTISPECIES: hypothetical protein [unclassified Thermococcus]NJE07685.1 hypothetical protein [Thermococcus sp. M39]NJE12241.1 hypothetical protein [Thermococcus sp. LS2]